MENENKNIKIVSHLYRSLLELLKEDFTSVEEILSENGIDITMLDKSNSTFIKDLQVRVNIELGRNKALEQESILAKARTALKNIINIEAYLSQILSNNDYNQLSIEFRNLKSDDNQAKIELLSDLQLLKLMEHINKENQNE